MQLRLNSEQLKIVLAFLVVYLVWGSTYVAVRFTLESMPPLLMVALRFFIAGAIMCTWMHLRGTARPQKHHIVPTAVLGTLLLVFGSTGVALAERSVPSSLVALLVATVPVFVVLLQWVRTGGVAPDRRVIAGILVGVAGLILLLGPDKIATNSGIDLLGVFFVLLGSLGSAAGSLYARSAKLPDSQPMASGLQMLFAGLVLFIISACAGEFSYFQHVNISLKSGLALVYLIVFGSMLAFSSYGWLLKMVPPARVSTYAYVNPVIAVFLGWFLAGEGVTSQTLMGAAVILSAVFLITKPAAKQMTPARINGATNGRSDAKVSQACK